MGYLRSFDGHSGSFGAIGGFLESLAIITGSLGLIVAHSGPLRLIRAH